MLRAPLVFPHSRKLIWIFQPCCPRKPTVLEPHDRGIPFNPESVCAGHLPLFWCLQRRWKWQVRNHSHASRLSLTECFRSPGYALTLLAESTTFATYCAEAISEPGIAPEDVGLKATRALLAEIEKGGCVDQRHQILVLLMMVLGSEDVGRCRMSEPTSKTWVPFRGWVFPCAEHFVQDTISAGCEGFLWDFLQDCSCRSWVHPTAIFMLWHGLC